MTNTTTEAILEKIKKLNAHAESAQAIGNEAEAEAFAAKVQELLTAYKLSMADLGRESRAQAEHIDCLYVTWKDLGLPPKAQRVPWVEQLAILTAKAYYCEYVVSSRFGNIGFFVGTDTDRQVARFMFITLARALNRLAAEEYNKFFYANVVDGHLPKEKRGFKAGFMTGFIRRLSERFDDEVRPKAGASSSTAIVLLRKDSLAKVQAWMKGHLDLRPLRGLSVGSANRDGYHRGRDVADGVNLRPNPIEGQGREKQQLR